MNTKAIRSIESVFPAGAWLKLLGVAGFALLCTAAAQIRLPAPGTPVPMTLQTLVVVLAALAMGPRLAAASMGIYLLLGLSGFPAFAAGTLWGPTGGYLLGFAAAPLLIGPLADAAARENATALRRSLFIAATSLVAHAVIFACGVAWLATWTRGDVGLAAQFGIVPFLGGTAAKTVLAMGIGAPVIASVRRKFG